MFYFSIIKPIFAFSQQDFAVANVQVLTISMFLISDSAWTHSSLMYQAHLSFHQQDGWVLNSTDWEYIVSLHNHWSLNELFAFTWFGHTFICQNLTHLEDTFLLKAAYD